MATQGLPDGYTPQSSMYRKVILAMVGAGLASFNALYCTQALLPVLSEDLHVTPATASLTVSATTGMLALSIIPASNPLVFSSLRHGDGLSRPPWR